MFTARHSIRPRGLVEILPNLLRDKAALKYKHPELQAYIRRLDKHRFYDKAYLEGIKAFMEKQRLVFWKRLDVTIIVEPTSRSFADRVELGVKAVTPNGTPIRVLDFYHTNPQAGGRICHIVEEGSYIKPWVMRCGSSVGVHGIKRVARMIAIVKECIDPDFDLEGDSPPPPSPTRARIKRSYERMMQEMESGAVSSPEYYDAVQTVAFKVQRLNDVEETAN